MTSPSPLPRLTTDRLVLRAPRPDDFEPYFKMWSDPLVVGPIGLNPLPREASWNRFLRDLGHWWIMGYGYWTIEDAHSNDYLGLIGFAHLSRHLDPPLGETPEMGWVLTSDSHGRGYGSEALRAALEWGGFHFGPVKVACLIDEQNQVSLALAEKFGFTQYASASYLGRATRLLSRQLD